MRRGLFALVVVLLGLLSAGPGRSEVRVALVIGNSRYEHTAKLQNPGNDAVAVATVLRRIGFKTTISHDLSKSGFETALKTFAREARGADMAVVYYAGHGMEIGGVNYLVPVDAALATDEDVDFEAVSLDLMLRTVEGATRLKVVILDACRNNPFLASMRRTSGKRAVGRGLARVEPAVDTFVAYAAKEGTLAADGDGKNSPFAEALVRQLPTPGLDIRLMFGKVRDDVLRATARTQEPFVYGSGGGEAIYLVPPAEVQAARPGAAPAAPVFDPRQVEVEFWQSVRAANNAVHYQAYLKQYPSGAYAELARLRLASLTAGPTQPSGPAPSYAPSLKNAALGPAGSVARSMGLPCQLSDARIIGEDRKTKTSYYEVACGPGQMGFVLQAPAGGQATAYSCVEANTPPLPGARPAAPCILAGNANATGVLAAAMSRSGFSCSPLASRGIGQTRSNTYLEIACAGGLGYIVISSVPFDGAKPVQVQNCLLYDEAQTNVQCILADKVARLAIVDGYAADSRTGCAVADRRFIGVATDNSSYYEASCMNGQGYMFKAAASGNLLQTFECANATQILGGCRLSDGRRAR